MLGVKPTHGICVSAAGGGNRGNSGIFQGMEHNVLGPTGRVHGLPQLWAAKAMASAGKAGRGQTGPSLPASSHPESCCELAVLLPKRGQCQAAISI